MPRLVHPRDVGSFRVFLVVQNAEIAGGTALDREACYLDFLALPLREKHRVAQSVWSECEDAIVVWVVYYLSGVDGDPESGLARQREERLEVVEARFAGVAAEVDSDLFRVLDRSADYVWRKRGAKRDGRVDAGFCGSVRRPAVDADDQSGAE